MRNEIKRRGFIPASHVGLATYSTNGALRRRALSFTGHDLARVERMPSGGPAARRSRLCRADSHAASGFTLIELMVVITILAVLTILAVTSYKHYVRRAHGQEARQLLMEIKMKQEQHFANYSEYVTANPSGTAFNNLYPTTHPKMEGGADDDTSWSWDSMDCTTPNTATDGWCMLGFRPQGSTRFRVGTWGWSPATPDLPALPSGEIFDLVSDMDLTQRWYFAIAQRDADGNGIYATYVMTSQYNDIMGTQETE